MLVCEATPWIRPTNFRCWRPARPASGSLPRRSREAPRAATPSLACWSAVAAMLRIDFDKVADAGRHAHRALRRVFGVARRAGRLLAGIVGEAMHVAGRILHLLGGRADRLDDLGDRAFERAGQRQQFARGGRRPCRGARSRAASRARSRPRRARPGRSPAPAWRTCRITLPRRASLAVGPPPARRTACPYGPSSARARPAPSPRPARGPSPGRSRRSR